MAVKKKRSLALAPASHKQYKAIMIHKTLSTQCNPHRDYYSEVDSLPLVKQFALSYCNMYEAERRDGFSWSDITPQFVYEKIASDPSNVYLQKKVAQADIGVNELLSCIEHFIEVRIDAEYWANILARDYVNECAEEDGSFSVRGSDVDSYISEVARKEWELSSIIQNDPILHSLICLETSRKVEFLS
jgi:hypothetical protein